MRAYAKCRAQNVKFCFAFFLASSADFQFRFRWNSERKRTFCFMKTNQSFSYDSYTWAQKNVLDDRWRVNEQLQNTWASSTFERCFQPHVNDLTFCRIRSVCWMFIYGFNGNCTSQVNIWWHQMFFVSLYSQNTNTTTWRTNVFAHLCDVAR